MYEYCIDGKSNVFFFYKKIIRNKKTMKAAVYILSFVLIILFILLIIYLFRMTTGCEKYTIDNPDADTLLSSMKMPSDDIMKTSGTSLVFSTLYRFFLNQEWPLMSSISFDPPLLNVAYPDSQIVYYTASFDSSDTVTLSGVIPPLIYFWSLTIYDNNGLPVQSWDHTLYPQKKYSLTFPSSSKGLYCVIQRVYKTTRTPPLFPAFVPKISILNKDVEPVSMKKRIVNSLAVQKLLWNMFKLQHYGKSLADIFPDIDIHRFFLPSAQQLASTFPNPFARYLIAFPRSGRVLKITGTLPSPIGMNNPVVFVSFMASNFTTSATDSSISFDQLPQNYTLYIAYSQDDALKYGYNSTTDKLLLWDAENDNPVVVYRIVSASLQQTTNPQLTLFFINNQNNPVSGQSLSDTMGTSYPSAIAF